MPDFELTYSSRIGDEYKLMITRAEKDLSRQEIQDRLRRLRADLSNGKTPDGAIPDDKDPQVITMPLFDCRARIEIKQDVATITDLEQV